MKKLLAIITVVILSTTSFAQSPDSSRRIFKPFKVDISLGYASPSNSSSGSGSGTGTKFNGGVLFAIEPQFAVIDPLAIGVRVEGAVMAHIYNGNNGSNSVSGNSNGKVNLSYLLTAEYYFTNTRFRPFIGEGGGIYTTAAVDSNTVSSNSGSLPSTSQFGFMARAGFNFGHLRVAVEYNFVANNASYLGLKLGVGIGGGRRRK